MNIDRIRQIQNRRPAAAARYRITNDGSGPTRIDVYDDIVQGGGWFGGVSAQDVVDQLAQIEGDVEVHINSGGGDVFEGIAIFNALAARPGGVTTVVDGIAASIASVIAQGGKTRIIAPGAMMMIHDALCLTVGNAADHREVAGVLDEVSDSIASVYASRGGTPAAWRDAMQAETWYSAQSAVDAGLADKLAEHPADQAAVEAHDLSMFARVPDWLRQASETRRAAAAADQSCADLGHQCCQDAQNLNEAWHRAIVRDELHVANADVDESAWDGPAAMSWASKQDNPEAAFRAICAGEKTTGEPDTQAHWALPHHKQSGEPPNRSGVSAALGRLGQTQDLKSKTAAENHLKAHQSAMGSGSDNSTTGLTWAPDAFKTALAKEATK